MSYACPYPDELLEKWDGVCNPMGNACNDCENYECEHNMNGDDIDVYIADAIRLGEIEREMKYGTCESG